MRFANYIKTRGRAVSRLLDILRFRQPRKASRGLMLIRQPLEVSRGLRWVNVDTIHVGRCNCVLEDKIEI